jgi:hypothetical protein
MREGGERKMRDDDAYDRRREERLERQATEEAEDVEKEPPTDGIELWTANGFGILSGDR